MKYRYTARPWKLGIALTLVCALVACEKKAEEITGNSTTPTDGSQTAAQLAGTGVSCAVFSGAGSALNGKGYTRSLTLNADGTYTYAIYFSDHTGCATAFASGGNNIATYYQAGIFTVGGTAGTPSTATKITFMVGSGNMIIRASDAGPGAALATWINAHCTANPGFNTSADSTKNFEGLVCVGDGTYNFPNPPASTATAENIGYFDGTDYKSGALTDFWSPGAGGFPSSYTETFTAW